MFSAVSRPRRRIVGNNDPGRGLLNGLLEVRRVHGIRIAESCGSGCLEKRSAIGIRTIAPGFFRRDGRFHLTGARTDMPIPTATATPATIPHDDVSEVHPGDVLVHPKFGRCTVTRIEGDQEFVHVQLSNSRIVRLSLDIMTLQPQGTDDGQRIFAASID